MHEQTLTRTARPAPPSQRQQALLRAVVGSLVLCAALGANASAQQSAPAAQESRPAFEYRPVDARPLRDLLAQARRMLESGELDVRDNFEFIIEADRDEDGTLHDLKLTADAANPRWQELVNQFAVALSESHALKPLEGVSHLVVTIKRGDSAVVQMAAAAVTAEQATRMADRCNALLAFGRARAAGRVGVEVLNNMTFSASGKQLSMKLELSREQVGNLLRQHLSIP